MQAAKGFEALGAAARFARTGFRPPNPGGVARSTAPPAPPPGGRTTAFNNVVHRTHSALSRLFSGLATQLTHLPHHATATAGRSAKSWTAPPVNLRAGLSLPARHTLSRPPAAPFYLPRPPAVPRSTMQVGLGKARQFSTARPIFQHLVENVPITGRALWEADWDLRLREEAKLRVDKPKSKPKIQKTRPSQKERRQPTATLNDEFAYYFSPAAAEDATTVLHIPLAPTPTNRLPLVDRAVPDDAAILPLATLSGLHTDYSTHRLRVAALFDRLDTAKVWDRGATIHAFGDLSGLCTILEITFRGWTEDQVRSVLGEAGQGWCTMSVEQPRSPVVQPSSFLFSEETDSYCSNLVFPTLEVDTLPSIPSETWETRTLPTASEHDSEWDSDNSSDKSDRSDKSATSWSVVSPPPPPEVDHSWMLSADFARRAGVGEGLFY